MSSRRWWAALAPVPLLLLLAGAAAAPSAAAGPPAPSPDVGATDGVGALASTSTFRCPAPRYGVQHSAPGAGKTVALTFDDGPGASTMQILTILQRYGVPATFFNLGANESARPTALRAEAALNVAFGNHTWDHPDLTTLSAAGQASQLDRANAGRLTLVNQPNCLFRPPYGAYNTTTLDLAFNRRMSVWNWSVDTEDWKANGSADQFWVDRIVALGTAGGSQQHPVVLMHNQPAGNPATVAALPRIIDYYRANGYTFVDLLGTTGYTVAALAVAATAGGLHLASRTATGGLAVRHRVAGAWTGATTLTGTFVEGPAAVAVGSTSTAIFAVGTDNRLHMTTVADSGAVGAWLDLGGVLISRPTATVDAQGVLRVSGRGTDGAAWMRERTGGVWGAWFSLGGSLTSGPGATTAAGREVTLGAAGVDRAVWVRHRSASWGSWTSLAGTVTAEPGLAATAGGTGTAVFVRGTDNACWVRVGNATATSWGGWTRIGGGLMSGPAAVADGSRVNAYVYGLDGRIWENVATNGAAATGWSGWHPLPG